MNEKQNELERWIFGAVRALLHDEPTNIHVTFVPEQAPAAFGLVLSIAPDVTSLLEELDVTSLLEELDVIRVREIYYFGDTRDHATGKLRSQVAMIVEAARAERAHRALGAVGRPPDEPAPRAYPRTPWSPPHAALLSGPTRPPSAAEAAYLRLRRLKW